MRDIAAELAAADQDFAVASVIRVRGSAPRTAGAALAVLADGRIIGSVSGGCVEGAVAELAQQVLETGEPVVERFGCSADDPFAVGLTCGGELEILVQHVTPDGPAGILAALKATRTAEPVVLARQVPTGAAMAVFPDHTTGTLGDSATDASITHRARALLDQATTTTILTEDNVILESWPSPPAMLIFGAVDFTAALIDIGRFLGYHVVVCDARPAFATPERFPRAHEVIAEWPHGYLARTATDHRTVICLLTHDAKFDIPLLMEALHHKAAYIGALGSRRTHEDRLKRLRENGMGEAELSRLRSPIGLDLGGRTPEETAVAIAAEIIALREGGSGAPLTSTTGAIHHAAQ